VHSFFYLFNFSSVIGTIGSDFQLYRNQGLFWEPGILQVYMNILFFISAFITKSKFYRWVSMLLIITTFSTIGLLLLSFQLFLYYIEMLKKKFILVLSAFVIVFPIVVNITYLNLQQKIYGASVASSDLRIFDFFSSYDYIKKYPFFGIGLDMQVYIREQLYTITQLTYEYTYNVHNTLGMRGNTNSVLFMVVGLGIPLALLYFYKLYRQAIIHNKTLLFFIILILTNMSEPLILGNFFILLFLSSYYNKYLINLPKKIVEESGFINKELKVEINNRNIIISIIPH